MPVVSPLFAPATISEHKSFALYQLSKMDVCFQICGCADILYQICCNATLMAIGFVVKVEYMTLWVEVFGIFDKRLDRC